MRKNKESWKKRIFLSRRFALTFFVFALLLTFINGNIAKGYNEKFNYESEIDNYIKEVKHKAKIPNIAVTVTKDGKILYQKLFDEKNGVKPANQQTFYELGSNSKAFTAVAVYYLQESGLLRTDDNIKKYLPDTSFKYKGQERNITIDQLLHHTSGIAFNTLGDIEPLQDKDALERAVRRFSARELDTLPGTSFQYASANYDILGLIIQKVSGVSYEEYMQTNIFKPLGLTGTCSSLQHIPGNQLAQGHKVSFLHPVKYNASRYRGNTPSAYIMSTVADFTKWMNLQMDPESVTDPKLRNSILKSHIPDKSLPPAADGSFYGGGWFIQDYGGGVMMHAGSNPSFSSHMVIRKGDKLGVAILTDMNSNSTSVIGQGVMEIVRGGTPGKDLPDIYRSVDSSSFAVIIIAGILILLTLFFLIHGIVQLIWGKRRFVGRRGKGWISALISLGILAAFIYCLYRMPLILFQGLSWNTVRVWGPVTFELALLMTAVEGVLFLAYYLFAASFPATEGKSLFEILMMSVFSGFGNAFLIFIINMAVSSSDDLRKNLIQYFLFAVLAYVCGQRIVRTRLVSITNDMVYTKRAELITRLLKSPFERFENIQGGRIQAGLNNDTETVSNFANAFITALTNGVTLICCFTYLGILNIWGLLVSILIICIAMGMYTLVGMTANSLWEQTRNIQNTFFRFINDLMGGFKELRLNRKKRDEFQEDMLKACDEYRGKRKKAEYKFTNAVVLGELMFTFVIGGVAFLFPLLFKSIELSTLRSYVFVFLYMNGPIQGLLNSIPTILQMRISWKKINELISEISGNEEDEDLKGDETSFSNLRLEGVTYSYREDKENGFSVGPVDLMCSKGQIVFITGGNGSGKSTLAKLITGLYTPTGGAVYINGIRALPEEMGGYFSTIFSDFYLFDCLYGIDYVLKGDEIKNYLKILKMEEKVEIVDGKFSTIKLSSGQRKRLALLISYLEDKPVCMFDEWAADQDPEFRKFFYYVLLPELRSRGKLIFAITHDDRYFDIADTVLKMEFGKVV